MKNRVLLIALGFLLFGCQISPTKESKSNQFDENEKIEQIKLTLEEATRLSKLPLHCIDNEYPYKLGQVLSSESQLKTPKELHPAFYGCYDWHSSVHGHWSLVHLLSLYPNLEDAEQIKTKLKTQLTKENIVQELAYFDFKENKSFERTYGWAWLLKLQQELDASNQPYAKELAANLQPLTDYIVESYMKFLPKLVYPIRVGEHTNSAFGLSFAYDYALASNHVEFQKVIQTAAKRFYLNDVECPIVWEPSGYDFLSPCLQEAFLMSKILPKEEFSTWLATFLPQLSDIDFQLEVGLVGDREDAKLVHLDGVNFSRAWCLNGIANQLPGEYAHLRKLANNHINASLPNIVDGNYEGTHWLASFALYSLSKE